MSESPQQIGSEEISRFRAVVVAGLRAKQLYRGSKPRIEPDRDKHKNTSIAVEEVRRGLITYTPFVVERAHDSGAMRDVVPSVRESIPLVEVEHDSF